MDGLGTWVWVSRWVVTKQGRESETTEAFFCIQAKKPLHTGVRTGCHYLFSLSARLSVCVCVTFVVFTNCESCTRPISTKPGIYGSGRVWANAWDVFRRAASRVCRGHRAAVAFVVCSGVEFFVFIFFDLFFSPNAHGLLHVFGRNASFISLLVIRQGRENEATEAVFCL